MAQAGVVEFFEDFPGVVPVVVVDHDGFEILKRLLEETSQSLPHQETSVLGGDDDAEVRTRHLIQERASHTADDLDLCLGRELVVHPAEGPLFPCQAVVDLNKLFHAALLCELVATEHSGEEAALVSSLLKIN